MSSYTDVKKLIISNIKANGQREITGPILQDVLLNMLENSSEADVANKEYVDNKINDIPVAKGTGAHSIVQKDSSSTASHHFSSAFGETTEASGYAAHAEGRRTTASELGSHSEGYASTASGQASHAEGTETKATNDSAHAEGYKTTAGRYQSHAEGNQTYADGVCSHAEGFKTQTTNKGEHAEGLSNISIEGKTVHTVGIGSAEDNVENRKNAEEIHLNGDKYVYGIGGYNGTNSETEGIKTVQEVVNEDTNAVQIKYDDLKSLRDAGKLVPGTQYRITDYTCTTTQPGTKSAGHVFDIVVTADDESTLNEVARAVKHEGDTYFAKNDLNAWKICYCLDNDTNRFAWADATNGKGVIYRMIDEFNNDVPYDFKNIQFYRKWDSSKSLWSTISTDNTGVPCYTFSSNGNSATTVFTDYSLTSSNNVYSNAIGKYVSSNKQTLNNNCFFGDGCHCNTFGNDCNNNTFRNDCSYNTFGDDYWKNTFGSHCQSNTFGNGCSRNTFGNNSYSNTFGNSCYENTFGDYCWRNTFGNYCYDNTFGNNCNNNTFGNYCYDNTFGNNCNNNTFGNRCYENTFGNNCSHNTFGNDSYSNTFGNNSYSNTFGNSCYKNFLNSCNSNILGNRCKNITLKTDCNYNRFDNKCSDIIFGNRCGDNSFGNSCYSITFGNDCGGNSFGNSCHNNSFGNICYSNTLGNGCYNITFGNDCGGNSFGEGCYNNSFGDSCQNNSFGSNCYANSTGKFFFDNAIGNSCYNNIFGEGCLSNTFGNGCTYIVFAETISATLKYHFYQNNHFGDGCRYILFKGAETAGWNEQVQNYNFAQGLQGTDSAYLTIDGVRNRSFETKVAKNSNGEVKIYCEADLIL